MTAQLGRHITRSEEETLELAASLARELHPGCVLAIDGQLGAGKTAFVRGLVQGLGGVPGNVSSPTFVISQEYDIQGTTLVHIDAYRLSGVAELETIGWDEMLAARDAIIAVEWAERIAAALPEEAVHIVMEHLAGQPTDRAVVIKRAARAKPMRQCPICNEMTLAESEFAPFCSRRCKRADLGRWLSGKYKFSRPVSESDIESQD